MISKKDKNISRVRRHLRVRKKISGTTQRPRLCVYKSLNHIYAQIIDDSLGKTLISASTLDKELKENIKGANKASAKAVGSLIAKRAVQAGIKEVVFDRSGYIYHGKIKELAESARSAGLQF